LEEFVSITTADVKNLRELTGAGILDCKKALQETNGNVDEAVEFLRRKGLAAASKKASREANDGLVSAQLSPDGQMGVMVEVNCETDFVARTDDFKNFVEALVRQLLAQPHLDNVDALLNAPFIDNESNTVAQQLTETIAKLGENMVIRRVANFSRQGDGLLDTYIHTGGRVGVLLEVSGGNPNNPQFASLVHDLALQIAAAAPLYISEEEIPAAMVEAERGIYRAQLAEDKKPENIKDRIIEGKLKKWMSEVSLLGQEFVKDNKFTIEKLLAKYGKDSGNPVKIRRFARFQLGIS
jgi:elongation factor Ts